MQGLRDKDHPIWKIGQILAIAILVVVVEFGNANSIDSDEYRRIWQILGGIATVAATKAAVTKSGE